MVNKYIEQILDSSVEAKRGNKILILKSRGGRITYLTGIFITDQLVQKDPIF